MPILSTSLKISVSTLFLFIFSFCNSQTIPDLPKATPSGDYLKEGLRFYADQNYESAISSFSKVNENDTNYTKCLLDQAASYLLLKEYDKALAASKEALALKLPQRHSHYITASDSLIEAKRYDESLDIINEGLKEFPYNQTLSVFKVSSLIDASKHNEARKEIRSQLYHNHRNAGMQRTVAETALQESDYTRALLASGFALVLDPGSELSSSLLFKINEAVRSKGEHESQNFSFDSEEDAEDFSEIDLLIENYVALNKKFKTPAKVTTAVVKQLYLVLTKIEYDGDGLFSDYYLPIYKKILAEDRFRMFAYCLLASSRSQTHQELTAKYNVQIREFRDWFLKEMREAYSKQEVVLNGKKVKTNKWFDDDGSVLLIGDLDETTGKPLNYIEIYYPSGTLKGAGEYQDGKKTGNWQWFYENAQLKEEAYYVADKVDGLLKGYTERGTLKYELIYKDDRANGIAKFYDDYGNIKLEKHFVDDKLNGTEKYFFPNGALYYEAPYVDDKLEGPYKEYFAGGELSVEGQFKDDSRSGKFTSYYSTGEKHSTYSYVDGQYDGLLEEYYLNGQLARTGNYSEGRDIGEWKSYYKDGTLKELLIFDESGKFNGTIAEYDVDGKKHSESEYKKGKMIAFKAYNKDGSIRDEATHKGKTMPFVDYSPIGTVLSKGNFKAGERDGVWNFYHENGVIEKTSTYVDGYSQGVVKKYFNTGKLEFLYKVTDNYADSRFYEYYKNGKTYCEGWYSEGNKTGEWLYYYPNGKLSNRAYYLDDEKVGKDYTYDLNGNISGIDVLENGQLIEIIDYDTSGNELTRIDMRQPEVTAIFYYDDGKTKVSEGHYFSGTANNEFNWYHPNGKTRTSGSYINGDRHGPWKWYFYNGNLSASCNYVYGERTGDYLDYYEDGTLREKTPYDRGSINGLQEVYHENGKLSHTREYKNGKRHGKMTFYSEDGEIEHFRYYHQGTVIAYSYLNTDGVEVKRIPISDQTAKIESYFKNGKISRSYGLKNGLFHGTYSHYYSTGQLISRKEYIEGEEEGESKEFSKDGTVIYISNYKEGRLEGLQQSFYDNGKLKESSFYISGKLHGDLKRFDKTGNQTVTLTYHSGNLVGIKN